MRLKKRRLYSCFANWLWEELVLYSSHTNEERGIYKDILCDCILLLTHVLPNTVISRNCLFQINGKNGCTLVVSPLTSLITDQMNVLSQFNIPAASIVDGHLHGQTIKGLCQQIALI